MKINRLFGTMAVMLIYLSGSAQPVASNGLREKLNAFVESGEYQIQKNEKPSEGVTRYHFALQFCIDGGLEDGFNGLLLTPRLLDLEKAMKTEAVNAKTVYIHDASEGESPLNGVQFRFLSDSQAPTRYGVPFESGKNIRLISLDEADGQFYALVLIIGQTVDQDKNGDMILMDGWIHEVRGKKPGDEPCLTHHLFSESQLQVDSEEMSVDLFIEKVKRSCEIFRRESSQGKMAAGVVINKECQAFNGTLTKEQYYDLLSKIQPLVDKEENENLKNILAYSCYMIYKKSEIYVEEPSASEE